MKQSLFDDGPSSGTAGESFGINSDYAKRFEHNKQREELHRLKERHPELAVRLERQARPNDMLAGTEEDEQGSGSPSEEEDDGEVTAREEAHFFYVLAKLRSGDREALKELEPPDEEGDSEDEEEEEEDEESSLPDSRQDSRAGKRTMLLKDVLAEQAMQPEGASSDEDDEQHEQVRPTSGSSKLAYTQEQASLRDQFLQAAAGEGGAEEAEEGFGGMGLKSRSCPDLQPAVNERTKKLEQAFGGDSLSADDRFLKQYLLNEGWKEQEDGTSPWSRVLPEEGADMQEEDEAELERAERFEHQYNFRFEEQGADRLVLHPRDTQGTVRREDDRRKRARERQASHQAERASRQAEEVKRLKRLKRAELDEQIDKLRSVAGSTADMQHVLAKAMAGDFDPSEYDAAMASAFGEDYYNEDAEGHKKPQITDSEEDEPAQATGEGFEGLRARLQKAEPDEGQLEDAARSHAQIQKLLGEYQRLDYEDVVAGMPCKFRYRDVPKADLGLTAAEVFALSDKELNQVIGLRKLAPYREDGGLARPNYQQVGQLRGKLHSKRPKAAASEPQPGPEWEEDDAEDANAEGQAQAAEAAPAAEQQPDQAPDAEAATGADPGRQLGAKKAKRKKPKKAEGDPGDVPSSQPDEAAYAQPSTSSRAAADAGAMGPSSLDTSRETRLQTYARPSVAGARKTLGPGSAANVKQGMGQARRSTEAQDGKARAEGGAVMSKAQKKNMQRKRKRAEKHGG